MKTVQRLRCHRCDELKSIFRENLCRVITTLVILGMFGVAIGLLSRAVVENPLDFREKPTLSVVIVICFVALGVCLIGIGGKFISTYFLTEHIVVSGVVSRFKRIERIGRGRKKRS